VAESGVVVKRFPRAHPAATNGVAMLVGGCLLLLLSAVVGETWALPATLRVGTAVGYLVLVGSVGLFGLFLYTLARMPITVISYQLALMPLVTVVLASWLLDQAVTISLLVGAAAVFLGLYVGMGPRRSRDPEQVAVGGPTPEAALTEEAPPSRTT
jgi:drug/metabolite transporter (DMT)-like permease